MVTVSRPRRHGRAALLRPGLGGRPTGTDLDRLGDRPGRGVGETGCVVVGGDLAAVAGPGHLDGGLRRAPRPDGLAAPAPIGGPSRRPPLRDRAAGPVGGRTAAPAGAAGRLQDTVGTAPTGPAQTPAALVRAHRRPVARLAEGEAARLSGATAAIDLSDGLVATSGTWPGLRGGRRPRRGAGGRGCHRGGGLGGGEDYELLVATPALRRPVSAFRPPVCRHRCPSAAAPIGPGMLTLDGRPLPSGGWQHRF